MSEPKWTQGPWLFEVTRDLDRGCYLSVRGANHECVVAPYGYEVEGIEVANEHDARLLAASPDLYEALEALVTVSTTPDNRQRPNQWNEAWHAARAALRKARGET